MSDDLKEAFAYITELRAERDRLREHWKARAVKAEAERDKLREALTTLINHPFAIAELKAESDRLREALATETQMRKDQDRRLEKAEAERDRLRKARSGAIEVLKACVDAMSQDHPGSDEYWNVVRRAEVIIAKEAGQ